MISAMPAISSSAAAFSIVRTVSYSVLVSLPLNSSPSNWAFSSGASRTGPSSRTRRTFLAASAVCGNRKVAPTISSIQLT